jgi:16S rRNA C967 or C1407 C5-methylase (RsmB/RsmF family)
LLRVIRDYLPTDLVDRVRVTNRDAQRWCLYEQNRFDRVLLDAPCSSERHLLTNSAAMNEWTPARSRQLAMRQYAMLVSALDIVKIGGLIAYCTCSISPLECDDVISRLVKRRPHRFRILKPELPCPCEYTKHGVYFLPDYCQWGPLYFSLIERLA